MKIGTSVRKLLSSIYDLGNDMSKLSCFTGKVIYSSDSEIRSSIKNIIDQMLTDTSGNGIAGMLLIKRDEFNYEEEVRLLYSDSEKANDDMVSFDIDPLALIDSIVFAPKTYGHIAHIFKERLVKYGFEESAISVSKFYDPFSINVTHEHL